MGINSSMQFAIDHVAEEQHQDAEACCSSSKRPRDEDGALQPPSPKRRSPFDQRVALLNSHFLYCGVLSRSEERDALHAMGCVQYAGQELRMLKKAQRTMGMLVTQLRILTDILPDRHQGMLKHTNLQVTLALESSRQLRKRIEAQ